MQTALCDQCTARPAVARLRRGDEVGRQLCEVCLRAETAAWRRRTGFDVARFFLLLAPPRPAGRPAVEALPSDTRCPACGLTYAEFAAEGLAGCAACYTTFAEAILPALEMLAKPATVPA